MAGGTHSKTSTGYFETEYVSPWPGIDVSLPASRIDPGACVSFNGMVIRGGLTNAPALVTPFGQKTITLPTLAGGEVASLVTNLAGVTVIITNLAVYTDYCTPTSTAKIFTKIYTFPVVYSVGVHFGSVVIGANLYFSSAEQRGVYSLGFAHSIIALTLTNGGSGYTSNPTVLIAGGGGTGATGTATFTGGTPVTLPLALWPNSGSISFRNSLTITPPPDNEFLFSTGVTNSFLPGGSVTISGCANSAMNGTGPLLGNNISLPFTTYPPAANFIAQITNTAPYTPYTGQVGGSATYTPTGFVNSINLTAGGSGYTSAPLVTIDGPPGVGASAVATLGPITGMSVSEITANNGSGPFIGGDFLATIGQRLILGNIIGGDGNQSLQVASLQILNGGAGFPASGSLIFTGGGGENAAATFVATSGTITSVTLTSGGQGYVSPPTVTATGGNGLLMIAVMSTAVLPSTNNAYPDYLAWSFPSAYGYFDPNITQLAGGFDQLTEARGKITGIAIFESVAFVAHNGGFTEATVNTSSSVGVNIQPFTLNPLWSADQGVVCRYGSLAQYGALCCFLGYDQTYTLSPNGLTPVGDKVAALLQNFSLWTDGNYPNAGIYGSIIEVEGEKHYLVAFAEDAADAAPTSLVYDFDIKTWACSTWNYPGLAITCPIYQSYDTQVMKGATLTSPILVSDNLLLAGVSPTGFVPSTLVQVLCGAQLFAYTGTALAAAAFTIQFRTETPAMGRSQSTRKVCVEYENLSNLSSITLTATLTGQPDINSSAAAPVPVTQTFPVPLTYFTTFPDSILTTFGDPIGSAFTALATTMGFSTTSYLRIVRTGIVGQTAAGELN